MTTRAQIAQSLLALILLGFAGFTQAQANPDPSETPRLFVSITGTEHQQRTMPLVLANQAHRLGAEVRVLLCGSGAQLAVLDHQPTRLAPRDISAQDLLKRLIEQGVVVEVCALFLPNTDYTQTDLLPGIAPAKPSDVAAFMLSPNTRLLTH